MNSNLTEVLEAARALPRSGRAEVAQELIASLETTNEYDEARYAELHAAVDQDITSLDAGRSTRLSIDELEDYLSELKFDSGIALCRACRQTVLGDQTGGVTACFRH